MRLVDALVAQQPVRLLDRDQGAFGVLGDPGEHPFPSGLFAPAAIRLVIRALVVELQAVIEPAARLIIDLRDRVNELLDAVADQPNGVLRRGRAEHRRRVDDSARPSRPAARSPRPA